MKLTRTDALRPKIFSHCLKIKEFTALEPGITGFKFYCPNVGFVLETEEPSGGRSERMQSDTTQPASDALRFRTVPSN